MCVRVTRRDLLRTIALALPAAADPFRTWGAVSPATLHDRIAAFPMSYVRLLDGEIRSASMINQGYLDSLVPERLLHSFRQTAGIHSSVTPYGGWEAPDCELRGHFAGGHYLSAIAFAYASSDNEDLRRKGDFVVSALAECQKTNGGGYLSAYPPSLFEKLARGEEVWAPFYTLHKILAGLLDMYAQTGNEEALQVAEGIAAWTGRYFAGIGIDQRQRMLRVEYGGMGEALINLAQFTGKDQYIETACLFEQPSLLDPLIAHRDELQGVHANTTVPKIISAARMYEVTGEQRYRQAVEFFLEDVLTARSYAIGNMSDNEHWKTPAGDLKNSLTMLNAECCVAYNMMKLERTAFLWSGNARWMDAYERSLFNCRLGTQNDQGWKQYFFPLQAGGYRAFHSPDESFWCCTGTGAEDFAKFTDSIYFHSGDDLYINQFISSELNWKESGLVLRQMTTFPSQQGTSIEIVSGSPKLRSIYLRIPAWTGHGGSIAINGKTLEFFVEPGSYIELRRTWQPGDITHLKLPMELRTEALLGDTDAVAPTFGPLVLATDMGPGPTTGPNKIIHGRDTSPKEPPPPLPLPVFRTEVAERGKMSWIEMQSASDLHFQGIAVDKNYPVLPIYKIRDQRYSVYWRQSAAKPV
jgi:DUF1680 family protein